jgi:hypothetical protein
MRILPHPLFIAYFVLLGAGVGNAVAAVAVRLGGATTIGPAGLLTGERSAAAAGLVLAVAIYRKRLDVEHHARNSGRTTAVLIGLAYDLVTYYAAVWPRIPGSVGQEEEHTRRQAAAHLLEHEPMPGDMCDLGQGVLSAIDRRDRAAFSDAMLTYERAVVQHAQIPGVRRLDGQTGFASVARRWVVERHAGLAVAGLPPQPWPRTPTRPPQTDGVVGRLTTLTRRLARGRTHWPE